MNRKELRSLAQIRLSEAKALLKMGYPDGAYYLAGYSVECALKACIAGQTKRYDFPDKRKVEASHTHNLKDLMRIANLHEAHLEQAKKDAGFRNNWDLVQQWSEHSRYERHAADLARGLVDAVGHSEHGVMAWITQHW